MHVIKNILALFVVATLLFFGCIGSPQPPSLQKNLSVNMTNNVSVVVASNTSTDVVIEASRILINEILFDAEGNDTGQELIELYNPGHSAVNLNGWTILDSDGTIISTFPSIIFSADSYLIVYLKNGTNQLDFSNGSGRYYTGTPIELLDNYKDAVALYRGAPNAETIMDFVRWSKENDSEGDSYIDAVSAGIWMGDDYFDLTTNIVFEGESIGRDMFSTDTNSSADWFSDGGANVIGMTFGKDNSANNIYDRTVSGILLDENENPLSGVKVDIKNSSITSTTDSNGVYYLLDVPAGKHILFFAKDNYVTSIRSIDVTNHKSASSSPVLIKTNSDGVTIGPMGGTVKKSNVTIEIPAGALNNEVNITITRLPAGYVLPEQLGNSEFIGSSFSIEPSGLTFNKPVKVTFPLSYFQDSSGKNISLKDVKSEENITIFTYNPLTSSWLSPITGKMNDDATANFETTHFSTFIGTATFYMYWIKIDKVGEIIRPPITYEGRVWCGTTETKNIKKKTQTEIIGNPGMSEELLAAHMKIPIGFTVEKSVERTFTSRECEMVEVYSYLTWDKYVGEVWEWSSFTSPRGHVIDLDKPPTGYSYYGDLTIFVPSTLELFPKRVDKTKLCCPKNQTKASKTRHIKPVDSYGNIFGSVLMAPGETLAFAAMGYSKEGAETGYPMVSMKTTGTLDPPISYISDLYYTYTPDKEGQGQILIKDGQGHFTQIAVTVKSD